jgi:hypothetical protein
VSRQCGQHRRPVCRSFSSEWSRTSVSSTFQAVSRDVARARECPLVPKCTRLVPATTQNFAITGNTACPFAGLFFKPSDGLEPSTPSLPWRTRAAGEGRNNSACLHVFPATALFRLPAVPLPRRALTLPEKPQTCPQDLSPDEAGRRPRPRVEQRPDSTSSGRTVYARGSWRHDDGSVGRTPSIGD